MHPVKQIEALCRENGVNTALAAKVARSLDRDIFSTFINNESFIYELLQNADDHALEERAKVSITLSGDELIFSHSGRPFSREDVQRICDYGNTESSQKSADLSKTGYKDIGFKSVFKVASRVDILSKEWRFHFDEFSDRWKRKEGDNPYPWQIAPLWTEISHLSERAQKLASVTQQTHFIFRVRTSVDLAHDLKVFAESSENLLFLKRIRQIDLQINGEKIEICAEKESISINKGIRSRWKRFNKNIPIPDPVQIFLKELRSVECPERLRQAKSVPLSFAFQINEKGEYIPTTTGKLFSTLPTGVKTGIPFHIHGLFLLNPPRKDLENNLWNDFLIIQIAQVYFEHIRWLLKENEFTAIQIMIPQTISSSDERFKAVFEKQLQERLAKDPFLPTIGKKFVTLNKCLVDRTGLFRQFADQKISFPQVNKILHPEIDPELFLAKFPAAKQLPLSKLICLLPHLVKGNIVLSGRLLDFFAKIFSEENSYSPKDLQLFKQQPFVVTSKNTLETIEGLFLPAAMEIPIAFTQLPLLHSDLHTPERVAWLAKIGVSPLTTDHVIEFYQTNLKHPSLSDKSVVRSLFHLFSHKLMSEETLHSLAGISLISKKGTLSPASALYLSDLFFPQVSMETLLRDKEDLFVTDAYMETGDDISLWKKFFLSLGVMETCTFQFHDKITVSRLKMLPSIYMESYLKSILELHRKEIRGLRGNDEISGFVIFPLLERIAEGDSFCTLFWKQLSLHQKEIMNATCTYHAHLKKGITIPVETFLQFLFRTQNLVRNGNGELKTTQQLYAPSLNPVASLLGDDVTAFIPADLSLEMEKFLGFKTHLSISDCETILINLQKRYLHTAYKLVLEQLLILLREKKSLPKGNWKFQDGQGNWLEPQNLKYWPNAHSHPPHNAPGWIKRVFNHQVDHEEFCSFFKIEKGEPLSKKSNASNELKSFMIERVPEIAYYLAHHQNFSQPERSYIHRVVPALDRLKFFLISEEEESSDPQIQEDNLYYPEDWHRYQHQLVKVLGKYLQLEKVEYPSLSNALGKKQIRDANVLQKIETFRKAFIDYRQELPGVSLELVQNLPTELPSGVPLETLPPSQTPVKTEWIPHIAPNQIKTLVHEETPKALTFSVPKSNKSISDIEKKRIGNWAEEHMLQKLIQHYMKKHELWEPEISSDFSQIRFLKNDPFEIQILWHNDPKRRPDKEKDNALWDSGKQWDIEVTWLKNGSIHRKRFIEVKGTVGPTAHFFMSPQEWQTAIQKSEQYRLYVVTHVGTADASTKAYNLIETLREGSLTFNSPLEFMESKGQ